MTHDKPDMHAVAMELVEKYNNVKTNEDIKEVFKWTYQFPWLSCSPEDFRKVKEACYAALERIKDLDNKEESNNG